MRIQHNIMAMSAYRNYTNNVSAMKKNLEKLSSGYKINRAGDDAAGLAISEKMRAQITGLETAQKNAKDGISLVQTAEGALTEVHDMLNRMVELATQSANGTYDNTTDRNQMQKEVDQLRSEINRIADSSNFNGIKLLDGSLSSKGGANVTVKGVGYSMVNATYGKAVSDALQPTAMQKDGDYYTFSVGMDDGTSVDVTVKAMFDPDDTTGKGGLLVDSDGNTLLKVADLETTGFTTNQINAEVAKLLKKNDKLSSNFKITGTSTLTFENIEAGKTGVVHVNSLGWHEYNNGATASANGTMENITIPTDKGVAISKDDIVLYNGKNADDAIFTINGKKFAVLTWNQDFSGADIMKATEGLGKDVTVLVAQDSTNKGVTTSDANFNQNMAKIKEVTGLDVRSNITADGVGSADTAIVISASGTKGGLRLQIGDTAEDFNQIRVGISDCHCKAIGIENISVADQDSAAAAVDAIKEAINYVSDVRGTLGATQNRLDHTINNLSVMTENIQDAESTIRDVDVAEEMMAYTKNNILIQSAQAMLAQANQVPQGVLQLLQ